LLDIVVVDYPETQMKYTLITPKGVVRQFFIESMANLYKDIHGGVVVTQQILEDAVDNSAIQDYNILVD